MSDLTSEKECSSSYIIAPTVIDENHFSVSGSSVPASVQIPLAAPDLVPVPPPEASRPSDAVADYVEESLALDDAVVPNDCIIDASNNQDQDNTVRSRRYDVSITYDNYYRTPRLWLFGYDEKGSPLSPSAVFQVRSSDFSLLCVLETAPCCCAGHHD